MSILSKINRYMLMLAAASGVVLFQSCTEEIDTSSRYTFTGSTIVSHLQDYPDTYSEYSALLDSVKVSDFSQSTMSQLLSARGNYTCFAPTNEAIQNYLAHLADSGVISEPSWNAPEFMEVDPETQTRKLLEDVRRTIVYNSLIDGDDDIEAYVTSDIIERAESQQMLGLANMNDRKLQCDTVKINGAIRYTVGGSLIHETECDIYTINGRIHQVNKVIAPNTQKANDFFEKIIDDKAHGFYTFAALVEACGLSEALGQAEDEEYYRKIMTRELEDLPSHVTFHQPGALPERRYIGYTIFAEHDSWWEENLGLPAGSITEKSPEQVVELVADYVQSNNLALSSALYNEDYTDENNALNQFVTYHIIPGKLETNKLVIHFNELWYNLTDKQKKASVYDFYTTMGKRRLIKAYEASNANRGKIFLNRFPVLKNGRGSDQDYTEVSCDEEKKGIEIYTSDNPEIYNAYFYRISSCLYYNDDMATTMASERIRIDFSSIFPELMSNDIRANENITPKNQCVGIPVSSKFQFLADCDISDQSQFYYLSGRISETSCWQDYQGDEINVVGNYELTLKLPPVPKDGIYELRLGVQTNDRRGMCQVYWGNDKSNLPTAGLPLDMRMGGKDWYVKGVDEPMESILGYEEDVEGDDELNAENDKKMRNNMCMKAPNYYYQYGNSLTMRNTESGKALRRIIVREEMKADEVYYLRLKSVLRDPETELFLDFLEFCAKEVYDNPMVPEDIW